MALRRRILGRTEIILSFDPAVAGSYSEYRSAHYDRSKLEIKPGEQPTVLHIDPLTEAQKDVCGQLEGKIRQKATVRMALREIENYTLEVGGVPRPCPPVRRERISDDLGMGVTDAWFAEAGLHSDILTELSQAIWEISDVDPT